jgi:hypothetical protein
MEFLHRVDRGAEMFEGIVRPENVHFTIAKRPARVEVGGDPAAEKVDSIVTGGQVDRAMRQRPPRRSGKSVPSL